MGIIYLIKNHNGDPIVVAVDEIAARQWWIKKVPGSIFIVDGKIIRVENGRSLSPIGFIEPIELVEE